MLDSALSPVTKFPHNSHILTFTLRIKIACWKTFDTKYQLLMWSPSNLYILSVHLHIFFHAAYTERYMGGKGMCASLRQASSSMLSVCFFINQIFVFCFIEL